MTTLLDNNYKLSEEDCAYILFNNNFLNDYKKIIKETSSEEEIINLNKKWRNIPNQI